MIISMTGFGTVTVELPHAEGGQILASFELKSFNTRFFEASCKLPASFSYLEHPILTHLKKAVVRGKLYLSVRLLGEESSFEQVTPSMRTAKAYVAAAQQIQKTCGVGGTLSITDVVALPNVFSFEKGAVTPEQEKAFFVGLEKVIELFNKSRQLEGQSILKDLQSIFASCGTKLQNIETLAAQLMTEKKQGLEAALALSQSGDEQAKSRLEEHYKMLDKVDIHEEISRFKNHLATVNQVVADEQMSDKGRRLDFIVQELGREINTITAKCSSFQIGTVAVDVKVDLEKAREQVQNIV